MMHPLICPIAITARDPFVRKQDLTSVRTTVCSGATLAPDIITGIRKMMGEVELIRGYGWVGPYGSFALLLTDPE
jgi:hypothetical protein